MTPDEEVFERSIIEAAKQGDPSFLADALRVGFPLSQVARDLAADLVEGKLSRKPGGQRDPERESRYREIASVVELLRLSGLTLEKAYAEVAGLSAKDMALPITQRRNFRYPVSESLARLAYTMARKNGWSLPSVK